MWRMLDRAVRRHDCRPGFSFPGVPHKLTEWGWSFGQCAGQCINPLDDTACSLLKERKRLADEIHLPGQRVLE